MGGDACLGYFFFKLARGFRRRAVVLSSMAILAPSLYDGAALG